MRTAKAHIPWSRMLPGTSLMAVPSRRRASRQRLLSRKGCGTSPRLARPLRTSPCQTIRSRKRSGIMARLAPRAAPRWQISCSRSLKGTRPSAWPSFSTAALAMSQSQRREGTKRRARPLARTAARHMSLSTSFLGTWRRARPFPETAQRHISRVTSASGKRARAAPASCTALRHSSCASSPVRLARGIFTMFAGLCASMAR